MLQSQPQTFLPNDEQTRQQQQQQQQQNGGDLPQNNYTNGLPQQFSQMNLNNPLLNRPQPTLLQQPPMKLSNPLMQPPAQFNSGLNPALQAPPQLNAAVNPLMQPPVQLSNGGNNPLMRPTFPPNFQSSQLRTPGQFAAQPQMPPSQQQQQHQQNGTNGLAPSPQPPQAQFLPAQQQQLHDLSDNRTPTPTQLPVQQQQQYQLPSAPQPAQISPGQQQQQQQNVHQPPSFAPPTQQQQNGPPQFAQQQPPSAVQSQLPPQQQQQQQQFQPLGQQAPPTFNPQQFQPLGAGQTPPQPPQFQQPPTESGSSFQQFQPQQQFAPQPVGRQTPHNVSAPPPLQPPPSSQFQQPPSTFGQPPQFPPQQFQQPPTMNGQFQPQSQAPPQFGQAPPSQSQFQPPTAQGAQFGQPPSQKPYPSGPPTMGSHPLQNKYPMMTPSLSTPGQTPQMPGIGMVQPPQFGQQPSFQSQLPPGPPSQFSQPPLPGQQQQQFPYPQGQQPPMPGQQLPSPQQLQQHPPQPQATQQRIDPDAIPNPIDVMQACAAKNVGTFRTNEAGTVPPLTVTEFTCKDEGQSNPRFMRSTMYTVPASQDFIKQSRLPIALSVTPFATLRPDEVEPPISNLGELGPVRCKRCKAYMSPYMNFIDNGRRFQCSYCEDITQVPQEYFNHLDHMGKRVDQYERPELCLGSYEFIATKDYCRNQLLPSPPAFIFLIDVSSNSVRSGLLKLLCENIRNEVLTNLPREYGQDRSSIRVGFITYDKELHFYNLKSTLATPQMMIVSDLDDIFVPILDGFLVDVQESALVIDSLLEQIPQMFADNKETELLLGPAIEAGIEALQAAKCNGKLFIFHTGLPTVQCNGQLKNRDDKKLLGTDNEKKILSPQADYYSNLGKKCIDIGCCVDLFLMTNQYCDVATITDVLRKSGGQIYKYDFFMADTCGDRLLYDVKMAIKNTVSFDAVMKVRTSTGIKPFDYLGNFNLNGNDVELCGCDRDKTVCVELKHEDKLNENSKVYIQVAILYTSISGQRRIRLHNLNLNVTNQYSALYPSCELDTIMNYVSKLACRSVLQSTPKSIQENVVQQCASILACYRKNCASQAAKGQFILPETLKLMPLYVNSLLKSDAISGAKCVTVDERAYQMFRLMCMDVQSSFAYIYPRLISLHDLETTTVPKQIRCSYERLKDDGIYLLENGLVMYLWIGLNASPAHIQNLFGASSQQANIEKCKLIDIDTPISLNVRSVVSKINEQRNSMLKLIVTRQRDTLEQFYRNYLVEDKCLHTGATSYVDFLYQLHHEIRNILS